MRIIDIAESFQTRPSSQKIRLLYDSGYTRKDAAEGEREIKEVFKEVGDAAKNLLPGCITTVSQVPI